MQRLMVDAGVAALLMLGMTDGQRGAGRQAAREVSAFAWLAGSWEATQGAAVVHEEWSAPTSNLMIGVSRTIAGGKTTEFEFLRIEKRGDDLFYIPQPNGRPPVAFKLTSDANETFVFEQNGEDRVKKITYRRDGADAVHARVEGVQGDKPFAFEIHYRRRK